MNRNRASQLLVSVRNAEEAAAALVGGAHLIDVKEPLHGPLGRADDTALAAVVQSVAGRLPVSAALGELAEQPELPAVSGLTFAKWGLAGVDGNWERVLAEQMQLLFRTLPGCRGVAVAYADWQHAAAPTPEAVAAFAVTHSCGALLIDTFRKDGRTLLDWLDLDRIEALCRTCHTRAVPVALAGSLDAASIQSLRPLQPDWFAVRGAVCTAGRESAVDAQRVRHLADLLAPGSSPRVGNERPVAACE